MLARQTSHEELAGPSPSGRSRLAVALAGLLRPQSWTALACFEANWDVRAHRGHTARLAILDEGEAPWGHCLVDRVELFDTAD